MTERSKYVGVKLPEISADILRSAIRGSKSAQAELCGFYQDGLIGYFVKSRIPKDDVPDFSQDTWERVYKNLPDFEIRPDQSFRGFLFRIAGNIATDYYRELARKSNVLATQISMNSHHPFMDPEEAYELKELQTAIEAQLRKMPREQAIAFYHHSIQGDPHEVAAQKIEKSKVTTRKLASRGLGKMRKALTVAGLY